MEPRNASVISAFMADVARVESRTFICTETEEGAGPTNNWAPPAALKAEMTEAFRGSMKSRNSPLVMVVPVPKDIVVILDEAYWEYNDEEDTPNSAEISAAMAAYSAM